MRRGTLQVKDLLKFMAPVNCSMNSSPPTNFLHPTQLLHETGSHNGEAETRLKSNWTAKVNNCSLKKVERGQVERTRAVMKHILNFLGVFFKINLVCVTSFASSSLISSDDDCGRSNYMKLLSSSSGL